MSDETVLSIDGIGINPYSARGLKQTLEPIGASISVRRTVNGALKDISATQFRKFQTVITGEDQEPPAFDSIWPGLTVIIDCIVEIAYSGSGGDRAAVSGSVRESGDYTIYRPRIVAIVTGFSIDQDEYGQQIGWRLEAEEV